MPARRASTCGSRSAPKNPSPSITTKGDPNNYLRDTAHLSMIEDGAYRRLIDAYYIAEQPFADDKRELMKLCRAVTKQERDAVDYVLRKFFVYEEGSGWLHRRCEREIARFKDKQRKAKASADARWSQSERNANASAYASANAMRTHTERNADGMHRAPVPRHQTPDTTIAPKVHREAPQASPRASRIPPGWMPSEADIAFAATFGLVNGKAEAEASKFRDFWTAKSGKDATKLDWSATWRNWVRRAAEDRGAAPRCPPSYDPFAGAL